MNDLDKIIKAIDFHKDRANRKQAQLDKIRKIVEPVVYEAYANFTITFKLNILEEILEVLDK